MTVSDPSENFWALDENDLLRRLLSRRTGLSAEDARSRLETGGPNEMKEHRTSRLRVLWNQLRSPLLLILAFAAGISVFTGEWGDSIIVMVILGGSVGLGYSREFRAQSAADKLAARLRTRARVLRDGRETDVDLRDVVPGDIVLLSAGNLIPADARVLEASNFFVNEAVLTGESFPVEKRSGTLPASTGLAGRTNCVFLGANVRSGTARCLVVRTGRATEFGDIAHRLNLRPPETEFDRGLRRFGSMLTVSMLVVVLAVFAVNLFLERPLIETLLFSVALAVGLSPELLPAILNVNLARGARMMARHGVLVRHLSAIENLGSMTVLCTDKTGTLTEGVVKLEGAYDSRGERSEGVLTLAGANARFQAGLANPLDEAILAAKNDPFEGSRKVGEIPYDFIRKRMSVVMEDGKGSVRLIMKGALENVLEACGRAEDGGPLDPSAREGLRARFQEWTRRGVRVLGVAVGDVGKKAEYGKDDERDLAFAGFLTFLDQPKEGVAEAISDLHRLGVSVKLITGDSKNVAVHVASLVGMKTERVLTGKNLDELHEEALWRSAEDTDIFAEVDPNQKERIILSLKKMGAVVGFLGDGINDAPAMHAADTSLSVEHAVDVAREAADFVLLERDLDVIRRGIEEGRRTFANTLKYVLMTMSANLGNMLSMAVASLFLPFLPLLAGQVLLNNFLSDLPALGLADDNVDPELVEKPRRWDLGFIGRFMVGFGVLSSLFDVLTFALLLGVFSAGIELFRTGWFVESLLTELAVALVLRTRRPFFKSRPGRLLTVSTLSVGVLALAVPYVSFAPLMGFVPLPAPLLAALLGITGLYVVTTELMKSAFYRRFS